MSGRLWPPESLASEDVAGTRATATAMAAAVSPARMRGAGVMASCPYSDEEGVGVAAGAAVQGRWTVTPGARLGGRRHREAPDDLVARVAHLGRRQRREAARADRPAEQLAGHPHAP